MKTYLMPPIFRKNKKEKYFYVKKDEFGGWLGYGNLQETHLTRVSTLFYESFIYEAKRNKERYNTKLALKREQKERDPNSRFPLENNT